MSKLTQGNNNPLLRIITNIMLNSIYSKQRLISELKTIIDGLEKLPDEHFLINFETNPAIGIEIISYEDLNLDS